MTWNTVETLTDLDPRENTGTYLGTSRHTDAQSIRRKFGIPELDVEQFDYPSVIPGCLCKAADNSAFSPGGGTDALIEGPMGAGKSTFLKTIGAHLMDSVGRFPSEAVVWRASESRSEWISFAPWAKVCLPSSCEVEAMVVSTSEGDAYRRAVRLEDVVREVVYYDDPMDLCQNHLESGKFHVVYPDPQMTGCQDLYERSPKRKDGLEFSPDDPVNHWWVGFLLARVEHGSFIWTALLADEIGDMIPQSASKDQFASYQKVELYRDLFIDSRKYKLSVYHAGQNAEDAHEKVKRKHRWRVTLNGRANPTRASQVVGVNRVPMYKDLTSDMPTGRGLFWTETNFAAFAWPNIPKPTEEELRVHLTPKVPSDPADSGDSAESEGVVSL
ncbi:ATP-binding protein [Halorussus pelagicus]|uniref:ATP-binding protein n=1 Tax=Halorussus pelagicus TaxID=2505977 RepID=UPI000FFB142F|nr:ATP-binding protein [Halorussus pelagicus]